MNCPTCKTTNLVMSERQGIEIDYCPQCRGVWLDRGELDKIIDKSINLSAPPTPARVEPSAPSYPQQSPHSGYGHHQPRHDEYHYKRKKREGFLSELFDFD